ncbi:inositol/phosphatidylinositol phosphatase [Papiliotrema laurentii]|uniref:Inositol/phosphatidylinositol phosphatase n=1 Tax=Papiliotrema laurentii TaxID=5418 RepID=A0AAD9FPU0_PAPLA|nr:inositol/phosphatidylinositol phosphatase [Papiliotrema laurentii]
MPNFNCLPLHETLNLYVSPTSYVFEPASSSLVGQGADGTTLASEKDIRESLYVDRRTGRMALNEDAGVPYGREKVITCYGIIGVLSLATTDFLLIITARTPSCRLLSHPIYLATDFRLLPLSPLSTSSTILDHPVEKELISLVEQGLKSAKLWFSYGWDLTNTLQRQKELEEAGHGVGKWPLWKRADDRFFWNKFLSSKMLDLTENGGVDLSRFILPVVYGSVELRSASVNNRDLLFLLISRRSRYRVGTRYFSRGIDVRGNVANFNETEQIVLLDPLPENGEPLRPGRVDGRERLSFVQVRGSVPLFWAEINNLRYKPDLQIMDIPETTTALKAHLQQMIDTYHRVTLVNLVNHKGHELPVKEAFEKSIKAVVEADPAIGAKTNYVYFDFHTECRKMRFDRVSLLIDRLAPSLTEEGWFHSVTPPITNLGTSGGETSVISRQTGVVRSNCMDCLDRTNVSQSALGKWALTQQLRSAGVLSVKETIEDHPEFMAIFRNMWADHGDSISCVYAGTGALKSDYTRTGKRSREGMVQDGINSVMRYVKNNFFDGDRQDAFDILTGAWVAKKGGIPPLTDTRPVLMRSMPYILAFALTMILAALTLPRSSELSIYSFLLLWLALAAFAGTFIWGNGTSFVSWPRLNPPIEILSYNGPGARSLKRGRGLAVSKMIPVFDRKRGNMNVALGHGRKVEEVELGKRKGALID